jgi:hypothetical protein
MALVGRQRHLVGWAPTRPMSGNSQRFIATRCFDRLVWRRFAPADCRFVGNTLAAATHAPTISSSESTW